MHHHTKSSKRLAKLREEPQVKIKLPTGGPLRSMIQKLSVKSPGKGNSKTWDGVGGGGLDTIYYLPGDERRAVRKFIEENSKFVIDCFTNQEYNNPIAHTFDGFMLSLFQQEYEIMEYNDEI